MWILDSPKQEFQSRKRENSELRTLRRCKQDLEMINAAVGDGVSEPPLRKFRESLMVTWSE